MWKVLKTEFCYHKAATTAAYAIGVVFLIVAVLSGILKRMDRRWQRYMLSSNAFFYLIVALMAIFLDLGHFGKNTYRRMFAGFWALLVILIIWLSLASKILPVLEFVFLPYMTPAGATVFVLIAASLFYLDVAIYTRRKSYLK